MLNAGVTSFSVTTRFNNYLTARTSSSHTRDAWPFLVGTRRDIEGSGASTYAHSDPNPTAGTTTDNFLETLQSPFGGNEHTNLLLARDAEQVMSREVVITYTATSGSFNTGDEFVFTMDGGYSPLTSVPEPSMSFLMLSLGILTRRRRN